MKKILPLFAALLLAATFISCSSTKLPVKTLTITKADGTNIEVKAEVAKTPETRAFGFMERTDIPDGTGMIFVFENDQVLSFWMKNTPHPLSIAYIDSYGKIRDIYDMKPYSVTSITSSVSVKYALEVPQGWFDKVGIKKGDSLNLPSSW